MKNCEKSQVFQKTEKKTSFLNQRSHHERFTRFQVWIAISFFFWGGFFFSIKAKFIYIYVQF